MTRSAHLRLLPLLLLAILIVLTWAALFHGRGAFYFGAEDSDLTNQFYPWRSFTTRWLRRGIYPLWNPHVFGGMPVIEAQQHATFYPVTLICSLLLSPRLSLLAQMAVDVTIAAVGMFLFVRFALRGSRFAAAIAAATYVFGSAYALRAAAGHMTVVSATSWWPWAMLGFISALRSWHGPPAHVPTAPASRARQIFHQTLTTLRALFRPNIRTMLILAAVSQTLVIVAGSPQYVVYLGWMQVAALAALLPRRRWLTGICLLAVPWTLALALSSPQWLPSLFYLPYSARGQATMGATGAPSTSELYVVLLELIFPHPFGDDLRFPHINTKNVWEIGSWAGTISLIFVGGFLISAAAGTVATLAARKKSDGPSAPPLSPLSARTIRTRIPLAVLALFIYIILGGWLPGFGSFREVLKVRAVLGFALAIGAAAGFDHLRLQFRAAHSLRTGVVTRALPWLITAALLLAASATARHASVSRAEEIGRNLATGISSLDARVNQIIASSKSDPAILVRPLKIASTIAITSSAVALILLTVSVLISCRQRRMAAALALLAAVEPFAVNVYCFYSRSPYAAVEFPKELRAQLDPLLEQTRRNHAPPWRVVLPNFLMNRGHFTDDIFEVGGYDPIMPANANNRMILARFAADERSTQTSVLSPDPVELTALRWRAIAKKLDLRDWPTSPPVQLSDELSTNVAIASIERNVVAGSPAPGEFGPFTNGTHFVVPPEFANRATEESELPPEFKERIKAVATSASPFPDRDRLTHIVYPEGFPAQLLPFGTPARFHCFVQLTRPALLILRTTWLPGWSAQVDIAPREALVVDNWAVGVVVPPGNHNVWFSYRPVGLTHALLLSGGTALALLVLCASGWRFRRNRPT